MADPILLSDNTQNGNFINPAYATPEQVRQMRAYADALQKGSIADTSKSWTGVLAQALMGINGAYTSNRATDLEKQGIQSAARQDTTERQLGQAGSLPNTGIYGAITQQESGGNPNVAPSINGAIGPGQIMPDTFRQYARPGEDINNPQHNAAVSKRIMDDYSQRYGGDPSRVATAYFSGPGNVAPAGAPTPWVKDAADGNGKRVSSYVQDIARRLMGQPSQQTAQAAPGGISPYSAYQHNPWANPNEQALARGIITPAPTHDVYGRPGISSVAGGVNVQPVGPNYQPGVMAPVTAGPSGVTTQVPMTAPNAPGGAPTYGGGNVGGAVAPIAKIARDLGASQTLQTAAVAPQAEAIAQDQKDAGQAPQIFRVVNTILDDLNTHGDKMSMGPQSTWVNEAKKVIANYAPGAMGKDELAALAASESMEKASSTLGTLLGKQVGGLTGGTDASMFEGLKQVPGAHNSLTGAKALADMIKQGTVLQQKLGEAYRALPNEAKTSPDFDYIGFKNKFYQQHPIINPLTKHDILLDMREQGNQKPQAAPSGGWGIVR